jgi:RNA polymerase sigma-70 factor (ECF subfamily)
VLDPEVVVRADQAAQRLGSLAEIRGATAVAEFFKGRAQAAKPALVDGSLALAVIFGGQLRVVVRLTISGERISAIDAIADAEQIGEFDITLLN